MIRQDPRVGLPPRIAVPVLLVFAAIFLSVMGYFLRVGFGTTGSAFGPGVVSQQGDARIGATPVPIATDPPGTFTVPQTGTGPIASSTALPGASTGGGPPPAVMQEVGDLRGRIARNPKDLAALVQLGELELQAAKFDQAQDYLGRALVLDPANPDVRTEYAGALHETGHDLAALAQLDRVLALRRNFPPALYARASTLQAIGRRTDAAAAYRAFLAHAPAGDPRIESARAALAQAGR